MALAKLTNESNKVWLDSESITKGLTLATGTERNSCCIIRSLTSKQIYLVDIQPMKPITDMCVILCIPITKEDIYGIDVDENGPPEHMWDNIAPSTEENRLHSIAEGSEQLTEVSQQDLQDNQNMLSHSSMHIRFESEANKQEMPAEQYRQYIRQLNDQQKSIVMFHCDWCKKAILALKVNKPVEPCVP